MENVQKQKIREIKREKIKKCSSDDEAPREKEGRLGWPPPLRKSIKKKKKLGKPAEWVRDRGGGERKKRGNKKMVD